MATSSSLPVGFRFHPTGEELVNHYLKNKIKGQDFDDVIPEVDICSCEPWDLPGLSSSWIRSDDDEWYYFSRPDYKTKGNSRNRATKRGFWKITGVEREIRARRGTKALVGKKRTLTFYIGKVRSGQKTSWVIHEYYIPEALFPNAAWQRDFVLCRLKKKDEGTENGACDEGEVCQTSGNTASDFQNLMANFGRPSIQEETQPEEIYATLFPSDGSPHSPDYFATILRDGFLLANDGNDDHVDWQSAFRQEDSEDGHYTLEDRPRTTLFNHSHEPTSMLHKVYDDEGINRQGLSIQDTNDLRLYHVLKKNAAFVDVSANSPSDIGRVESVNVEESEYKRKKLLQSAFISLLKGEMVTNEGEELQSGSQLPLRQDDYLTQRKTRSPTENSSKGHIKQGFKPQEFKYTTNIPEKPMEPQKRRRNDERQMSMKQKQGDTTSSFIVWKETSSSLELCPPVIYIRNMIGGLVLSMFFVGELISYGKW